MIHLAYHAEFDPEKYPILKRLEMLYVE